MPYTHIRVAMFAPNTSADTGTPEPSKISRLPKERVAYVNKVIREAKEAFKEEGPETLRIFVAPEWLFRKVTPNDPYSVAEKDYVIQMLTANSRRIPDMLIIPGSVVWVNTIEASREVQWFNTVPVLFCGRLIRSYHKQHDYDEARLYKQALQKAPHRSFFKSKKSFKFSQPNFIRSVSSGGLDRLEAEEPAPSPANIQWQFWLNNNGNQTLHPAVTASSPFISINGLVCCVEICADFTLGTALRLYSQYHPHGRGVDLHFSIAAGVDPTTSVDLKFSTTRENGYLLMCNSNSNGRDRPTYQSAIFRATTRGEVKASSLEFEADSSLIQGEKIATLPQQPDGALPAQVQFRYVAGETESRDSRLILYDRLALPVTPATISIAAI